jgi:raffinose/stachyose/melibiose transport system substrate-binding protein
MKKGKLLLASCLCILMLVLLIPVYGAQQVTLTIWAIDSPTNMDPVAAYVRALYKDFQAKNPDIKLDWVALGNDPLKDKVKVAMANNQGPDIFNSWGGSLMGEYADAGRLLDLTKDLANVPGSDAAKKAMSWKGKIYGVAPFFAIAGIYVNEGILKANGLTVPTTIDGLEKVCDALKTKGIQPFACGARDKWPILATYMYLVNRYGGDIFTEAAARKVRFDADPFVKAGLKLQEWAKKGYLGSKPLGESYADAQLLMESGKATMHLTGSWLCTDYSSAKKTTQTLGFYAFPALPGGKGQITDAMGMTDTGFVATKFGASKRAAIVKFLKYTMTVQACSADPGRVCSVAGVKAPTKLTAMASGVFTKAKNVQFWWDQNLPPAITTPINETIQSFLLSDTNVKSELSKFEDLAAENMGPVKK